jgi:hypothetical protein
MSGLSSVSRELQTLIRKTMASHDVCLPVLALLSQYRQKQPRRRKNSIAGTSAYAGMPESKQGWHVCALIIRSKDQPQLVTCTEASCAGYKWHPICELFSNRHRIEIPARQHRSAEFTRGLIHLPQASAEISRRHINGLLVFVQILYDGDESRIRRGASGVQLQFDGTDQVHVMS